MHPTRWLEQSAPLGQAVSHPVADDEPPPRSSAPVVDEPARRMDSAEDEGDLLPHRLAEQRDVLDRPAMSSDLSVDLAAAAEDRYRPEVALAVDPVGPQAALRFEEGEPHVGHRRQPGLDHLAVRGQRSTSLNIADHHGEQWDRFSWYGFREVSNQRDASGLAVLRESRQRSSVESLKAIMDIEAILRVRACAQCLVPRNLCRDVEDLLYLLSGWPSQAASERADIGTDSLPERPVIGRSNRPCIPGG